MKIYKNDYLPLFSNVSKLNLFPFSETRSDCHVANHVVWHNFTYYLSHVPI